MFSAKHIDIVRRSNRSKDCSNTETTIMAFDLNAWRRDDSREITFSRHQQLLKEEVCEEALRLYQPQVTTLIRPVIRGGEQVVNKEAANIVKGGEIHFKTTCTTEEMTNLDESLRRIQNEYKEYPGKWRNAILCIVAPRASQGLTQTEDAAAGYCQIEKFLELYPFIHANDQIVCQVDSFREAEKHIKNFLELKREIVHRAIIVFNGHGSVGGLSFANDMNPVVENEIYQAISKGLGSQTSMSIRKLHVVFAQCFSHTLKSMKNLPSVSVHVFPLSTPELPTTSYTVDFEESSESQERSGERRVITSTHTEAQSFAECHSSTILKESPSETLGDNATASDVFTDKDETLMDEACALPGGDSSAAQPSFYVEPME